jgi:hypothetical protein
MRSFTLPRGLKDSTLASTVAGSPCVTRFNRTSGVLPIVLLLWSDGLRPQRQYLGGN